MLEKVYAAELAQSEDPPRGAWQGECIVRLVELERLARVTVGSSLFVGIGRLERPIGSGDEVLSTLMSLLWLGLDRVRQGDHYETQEAK